MHPSLTEFPGSSWGHPNQALTGGKDRPVTQAAASGSPVLQHPYPEAWEDGRLSHLLTYTCQV